MKSAFFSVSDSAPILFTTYTNQAGAGVVLYDGFEHETE
jgi:hypothetical protein